MDQVHVIRHKVLVEGQSVRRVAREMGVSRNTVNRYCDLPAPSRKEAAQRPRPVWDRVGPRIESILADAPRWTGGKQRLTATQLHRMLVTEGFKVGASLVRAAVAEWKRQRREVYVPLVYHPGELAEVDFFEVLIEVDGVDDRSNTGLYGHGPTSLRVATGQPGAGFSSARTPTQEIDPDRVPTPERSFERRKAWMFVMRLMHSGRDFARIYERQDQVSFLDGHVRAFAHFGAVPQRLAYDNLSAAVRKMLVGSERVLTARFEALASHYLFEASFCRPATGHDKGGVEARGRGIRLQNLVPIPHAATLEEINTSLLAQLDARVGTARHDGGKSVGELFALELGHMLPLPELAFHAWATHLASVSSRSLVRVEGALYSVLCTWARLDVTAHVGATQVELVGPDGTTVIHPRLRFGQRSIDYRHYLPELARKPQAVRQVAAELVHDLGEPFTSTWRGLVDTHGPRDAARIFAKVLGHVVERGAQTVGAALTDALARGEPVLLALSAPPAPEVSLEALPESLRGLHVAAGCATDYDGWLAGGAS